jgi:ribosome-associated translation inhibitor RaiA
MATSVISFKDVEGDEAVRARLEAGCAALAEEFPETTHFELILSADGASYTAHAHVTGNHTEVAARARATELAPAGDKLLAQLERQLRRLHDKKIFGQRRAARRASERRRGGS